MKAEIKALFPTPLYKSSIEKSLDKKQLKYLNSLKLKRNNFNSTSEETYLLEKPLFKNLKKEIILRINDYFEKIIQPADPIVPYITESWFNVTLPGERHHQHKHPNSLVSGVYYLNPSTIFFYKQYDSTIDIDLKLDNCLNDVLTYKTFDPDFYKKLWKKELEYLENFSKKGIEDSESTYKYLERIYNDK